MNTSRLVATCYNRGYENYVHAITSTSAFFLDASEEKIAFDRYYDTSLNTFMYIYVTLPAPRSGKLYTWHRSAKEMRKVAQAVMFDGVAYDGTPDDMKLHRALTRAWGTLADEVKDTILSKSKQTETKEQQS